MTQAWYIIECTSTKEQAACDILHRMGYEETFYPKRKVDARPRGKVARSAKKGATWKYTAWVYGYIFVCSEDIEAWRINTVHEHRDKIRLRVVAPGGNPYRVTDEAMAAMRDVPKRVLDLVEAAKAAERAAWEAKRPRVGGQAKITGGPFSGNTGAVTAISDGVVSLDLGLIPVKVPERLAERVA